MENKIIFVEKSSDKIEVKPGAIVENFGGFMKFVEWATSFLLITNDHVDKSKLNFREMTMEQAKMAFSNEYQDLFEASWNLRKLEEFPVESIFVSYDSFDDIAFHLDWCYLDRWENENYHMFVVGSGYGFGHYSICENSDPRRKCYGSDGYGGGRYSHWYQDGTEHSLFIGTMDGDGDGSSFESYGKNFANGGGWGIKIDKDRVLIKAWKMGKLMF